MSVTDTQQIARQADPRGAWIHVPSGGGGAGRIGVRYRDLQALALAPGNTALNPNLDVQNRPYHWRSHDRRMPWSLQSNSARLLQRCAL